MPKAVKPKAEKPKVHGNGNKIEAVVKNLVESNGKKPISRAMKDTGLYSDNSLKNPQQVTKSKTFKELMEFHLPESKITAVHEQLLGAEELEMQTFSTSFTDDQIKEVIEQFNGFKLKKIIKADRAKYAYFAAPQNLARKAAVEMAYKLRGSFAPEKHIIDLSDISDDEVAKELAELEGK